MKYILVDERINSLCEAKLGELGFTIFKLPKHPALPTAVCSHTDMLILRLGDYIFASREYRDRNSHLFGELEAALSPLKFIYTADILGGEYPKDAKFNCLIMGKRIFCNRNIISKEVLDCAERLGYDIISVKQGYPACTTLALGENLALTADRGMARALSSAGISVYLTENSRNIKLPPHEYGFIGGCCHRVASDLLIFGNPDSYEYFGELKAAFDTMGGRVIALDSGADCLFDLGGAVSYDNGI